MTELVTPTTTSSPLVQRREKELIQQKSVQISGGWGGLLLFRNSVIHSRYHRLSLSQSLDSEAPRQSPEAAAPAPSWPQQGKISFQDVDMRYRDHLPLVLKNLSFTVLPEETVGIVGRTGSGTADPFSVPQPAAFPAHIYVSVSTCPHLSAQHLFSCVCLQGSPLWLWLCSDLWSSAQAL